MNPTGDEIAESVLDTYNSLAQKYKPVKPNEDFFHTGMKCLPIDQVAKAKGSVLHDWHAEVVAVRAFNHHLLQECLELALSPENPSPIIRRRESYEISELRGLQPFSIREDVQLHMYSSEAPCGDASMELLMEAQVDATPWPVAELHPATKKLPSLLRGRESFAELGIVRRKPGADLAVRIFERENQCNAYLHSLVLPETQYVAQACDRSFGPTGRMKAVNDHEWSGGYAFRPFNIRTTKHEFVYSRRSKPATSKELRTSNIAAAVNPRLQEALILGRLQGRKKLDPKGASAISSKRMWGLTVQVLAALGTPRLLQTISQASNVRALRESTLFEDRQGVKDDVRAVALKGWVRNDGDDFVIEPD
ncbi:MAG: hypothetical protein Q9174_006554 [Haloplaca sp. 1 TL-2023]